MIILADINKKGEWQITKILDKPKIPIESVGKKLPKKGVLVLGSYSRERKGILHGITDLLEEKKYFPLYANQYLRWWGQTPRHWLSSLCSIVRFVIAEDSYPSGECLELKYCVDIGQITAIIRERGLTSSWMTLDFDILQGNMELFAYDKNDLEDMKKLKPLVNNIVEWAEKRLDRREKEIQDRINAHWKRKATAGFPRERPK